MLSRVRIRKDINIFGAIFCVTDFPCQVTRTALCPANRRYNERSTMQLTGEAVVGFVIKQDVKKWKYPNFNLSCGFQSLGQSNWTIWGRLSNFSSDIFASYPHSYWGAISY